MKRLIIILTLLLTLPVHAEIVCSVTDGDTFRLCNGQRVRLWGIDAPEKSQFYGREARWFLKELVEGKDVQLSCKGKSYNRRVCRGLLSGNDIAGLVVQEGLAFDAVKYSHGAYQREERQAKQAGLGVWQLPDGGVRPWVWRKH